MQFRCKPLWTTHPGAPLCFFPAKCSRLGFQLSSLLTAGRNTNNFTDPHDVFHFCCPLSHQKLHGDKLQKICTTILPNIHARRAQQARLQSCYTRLSTAHNGTQVRLNCLRNLKGMETTNPWHGSWRQYRFNGVLTDCTFRLFLNNKSKNQSKTKTPKQQQKPLQNPETLPVRNLPSITAFECHFRLKRNLLAYIMWHIFSLFLF